MGLKKDLKNDENGVLLQILSLLIAIILLAYAMNSVELLNSHAEIFSILIIGIISILFMIQISSSALARIQRLVFVAGYGLRISVLLVDIFAADKITIFHSGSDALGFWKASTDIYTTGSSVISSNYAETLNGLYQIFGANRILAQYVNILCFIGTVLIVLKICNLFEVAQKHKTFIIIYLCFLPNYICLSSILLRESMMIFFNTLGVFLFVLWMKRDKLCYMFVAFVAIVPAIALHSGAIGIWLAGLLVGLVWDARRQRLGLTAKTWLLFGVALCVVTAIGTMPSLRQLLMQYLPTEFTIQSITGKYFEPGGSDYLMDLEVTTWGGVAYWTVIRMIYFVFSPMPTDWRGISDIGAFMIDSIPTMVLCVGIITGLRTSKKKMYIWMCLLSCLAVCGVFAWGTSNAGTAMRHRGILVGVFAIAYAISKGTRMEK